MAPKSSATVLQNGVVIPVALLETIDLSLLEAGSSAEIEKLVEAAKETGFFYLDLRNTSSSKVVLDWLPRLYSRTEAYFDQLSAIKLNDTRFDQKPSQDRGYVNCSGPRFSGIEGLN